jgi:hypothetical protein
MIYVGIDPGKNGAIATIQREEKRFDLVELVKMNKDPGRAVVEIRAIIQGPKSREWANEIWIENINGWMGKFLPSSRMFTMGYWAGLAFAASVNHIILPKKVMAHKWQKDLGLDKKNDHPDLPRVKDRKKGKTYPLPWKEYLWSEAVKLFPKAKIPKQAADAVLIAYWAATRKTK